MLFPTVEYAVFFLLVLLCSWLVWRQNHLKKVFILVVSYIFYGFWDWMFVPLLFGISCLSYAVAHFIQTSDNPKTRKRLLVFGAVSCLSVLFYYKYVGFFIVNIINLLANFHVDLDVSFESPLLPLGISFIVFHAISLMGDAYRDKISVKVKFTDSLLYVAFFPQLIAGPILRASSFLPQLAVPVDPKNIRINLAAMLIVSGLFKKVVVSNILATRLVDPVFAAPSAYSGADILLAVYGYAAQIYCDFSGYTNIAAGCALLLGYKFPKNFNAPYVATNPQDFWHRWHISLSTWLRDYLYIPLGGSRGSKVRTYFNLWITMVLGGLWHGANWTFVIWGVLHGSYLIVHRWWDSLQQRTVVAMRQTTVWTWVSRLLLFHAVCIGWVFFRAPSFDIAFAMFGGLADFGVARLATVPVILMLLVGLFAQYRPQRWDRGLERELGQWSPVVKGFVLAVAIFAIELLGPSGVAPFIYFQF